MNSSVFPPTVSVVVPAHCDDELLERCLASIARLSPSPGEVIVAVDGDDADVANRARGHGARVESLASRSGPAAARNRGAAVARGEILFFIDSDVEVASDAIARLQAAFDSPGFPAAVFGSYDDSPADPGFLSQCRNLFHHYTHQNAREDATTFFSGLGSVRASVFRTLGGFDETRTYPSLEDVELGYRLAEAGYRIRLDKQLLGKHGKRYRFFSLLRIDFFERSLPWTLLLLSRPDRARNDLNLTWENRAAVVLAFLAIPAVFFSPMMLLPLAVAQGVVNRRLYAFFVEKRGVIFALRSAFWHWTYLFCAGSGFLVGISVGNRRRGSGLEATGSMLHRLKSYR